MRNSPWYVAGLVVFILAATGYVYATSEVQRVVVTGKHVETARGRRGDVELYVLDTNRGALPILQFPLIGYWSGVDAVYEGVRAGTTIEARVGHWPPAFAARSGVPGRRYILSIQ